MNERFFDLKKDRQDRIINGALGVITENGYRHASTDEMVAAASISKGLLFHYFKSKKGVYRFLYEYGTRYTLIELREPGRRAGCDYFEMQRLLMKADTAILRKYPCLPLFLCRADEEAPGTDVEIPEDLFGAAAAYRKSLLEGSRRPPFLSETDILAISRMLFYTRTGLMRDLLADRARAGEEEERTSVPLWKEYEERFSEYLQLIRRMYN